MTDDVNDMLTWAAVQGISPAQALATLKMELSDSTELRDMPGWPDLNRRVFDDRIFMGQLPDDWLLLFGPVYEKKRARLERLAKLGPTFLGEILRSGCFAEAHSYADGKVAWSVDYDFECYGRDDFLKVEESLPAHLAAIIGDAHVAVAMGLGRDTGVDILFEVPGRLSKAVCGFSPHEDAPEGFRWSMLQRIGGEPKPEPEPKGFFARLFGRK
jgi:hypothetical protein